MTGRLRFRAVQFLKGSSATRRLRAVVRTYPLLDAAARRVVRSRPRLRATARQIGTDEKTPNEVANSLVIDLLRRRRLEEAEFVARSFLQTEPGASRTRFLLGIVRLYQGDVRSAQREIDAAYARSWTIRDLLTQLPDWESVIGLARTSRPRWHWARYIELKSVSMIANVSPESLLQLVDYREPPLIVEFSIRFAHRHHADRPPIRTRHRVAVFEGTRSSVPLQRARLAPVADARVIHLPHLASAAEQPGRLRNEVVRNALRDAGIHGVDKVHLDAEYASADLAIELLNLGFRPAVITASLHRMTIEQRVTLMTELPIAGYVYRLTHDELVAVHNQVVADRRTHAWRTTNADFDPDLQDDHITQPGVDLAQLVTQQFIQHQVRFMITPTDDPNVTRFSLGNQDKAYAISRLFDLDVAPYVLHIPAITTIHAGTPLVRAFLIGDGRRHLAHAVELDFWTERSDYLRSANPNQLVTWIPKTQIERSMFAYNPPFLCDDPAPAITMESRLGLKSSELHHFDFDVDVVFTWVDGSDPRWQARRAERERQERPHALTAPEDSISRFQTRDELRFALRSVCSFMPYVRKIFLVTDDQTPEWFDHDQDQLVIVDHRDIFPTTADLPTFNSNAIECHLHRIQGLADHFVYFNDDVLLLGPTPKSTFFFSNGITKSFFERAQTQYGPADEEFHNSKNAVLNSSAAFDAHFDKTYHQFHEHTPFPLIRDVLDEMSDEFKAELKQTSSHHLRSMHDIAPISSLYQYYSHHRGRSVEASIRSHYINLGREDVIEQLDQLLIDRRPAVLCVNDAHNEHLGDERVAEGLQRTLERLFPVPAPWERS